MNVKMTFTVPEELAERLRRDVKRSKRSQFVASALKEKLRELGEEELRQKLIQDYTETREEDAAIDKEWEAATLETWP